MGRERASMRRPLSSLSLILALAASAAIVRPVRAAESVKPIKVEVGESDTYQRLGNLPLMHEGRIKPLDTVAREEIKQIYTRETIALTSDDGKTVTSWTPVAAFLDWTVRPKFWDQQPIIAVEYLPLKRLILADEVRTALENIAGKAATSEADRARLKAVLAQDEIDSASIQSIVRDGKLAESDALALEKLAERISEKTKWLSPEDLETADVIIDGKKTPFMNWLEAITMRGQKAGAMSGGGPKLSDLEQKAFEVGIKLGHYRAIRDKQGMGMVPLLVMPRPANQAMLSYSAAADKKADEQGPRSLSELEYDAAGNLRKYLHDIPIQDHAIPGTDPKFDARYTAWLKDKSAWVPLGVLRGAPIDELARAGYPTAKVEKFREAFKAMEDAEMTNPGHAAQEPALALIDAARDLGATVNASFYPAPEAMAREVHFNDFAPFFKAPLAYGLALLVLVFSLIATNFGVAMKLESPFAKLSKALYLVGIMGLGAGIGLEAYGFFLRIKITSWAPVTNMYETVIWVAMISSILGFVLELIYQKTWAALAASGIALVGTGLAATVPLLDPDIHMLPPVLRSNYWLTIHVLTIVSSYAAFALAMGLGMAGTSLYLTAVYKRSPGLGELTLPLIPGIPLLAAGWFALQKFYAEGGTTSLFQTYGFWPSIAVVTLGGTMTGAAVFAVFGELMNRSIFRRTLSLAAGATLSTEEASAEAQSHQYFSAALGAAVGGSAVMTLEPPRVSRSGDSGGDGTSDARALAMRTTAAQIKPISSFIYRAMQVGILLVAAGTFLGGWWADVSWGRFWGWDPKEVWALITLLVYLIPLHGRFAGWVNTFWLVMASVVCFLSVLMAWYGVNFVLGVGLHSYGAGAGGQREVFIATVVMLGFAAGAAWRRHLSQHVAKASV
jgi:ABC-type transport system involved in cytochrome c biogenesis permease subunit